MNFELKSRSEETSTAVHRTSCQRHRKRSRAWNQLLLPETEWFFLIFWIMSFEFSLGFTQDENAKMDFGSHLFGVAFLPVPNIFAIPSLVTLSKAAALRCQTDPGPWESALLLRRIWEVSEEEPQELKVDFLPPALLGIYSQENDSFCLKSLYPYAHCPRLPHSPGCKPHWLQNNSWCSSAFNFNPADIFPAEALIPSWISSPLVPRNE